MTVDRGRLAELCAAATEGPWVVEWDQWPSRVRVRHEASMYDHVCSLFQRDEDAEFIAAARSAVPDLLAALTEALADNAALRQALTYVTQPTTNYDAASHGEFRDFVVGAADEKHVRLALATCSDIARRALAEDGPPLPPRDLLAENETLRRRLNQARDALTEGRTGDLKRALYAKTEGTE